MSNLSFARIMYGTSEGTRNNASHGSPTFSSQAPLPIHRSSSPEAHSEAGLTLEMLLHKVWQALSARH